MAAVSTLANMTDWTQRPSVSKSNLIQTGAYLSPKSKRSRWGLGDATVQVYILCRTIVLREPLSESGTKGLERTMELL